MNVKRTTSPADAARFEQIKTMIASPEVRMRLQAATTTDQIRAIAAELGIDQQGRDMGKFISLIRFVGVDLVGMARDEAAARRAKLGLVASADSTGDGAVADGVDSEGGDE